MQSHDRRMRRCLFTILLSALVAYPAHAATVVATTGDASITHDLAAGTWTIAAGGAVPTLAPDGPRGFESLTPTTPAHGARGVGPPTDSNLTLNRTPLRVGK